MWYLRESSSFGVFEFLTVVSAGSKVNQQAVSVYILRQQFDPFTMIPFLHFRHVAGLRPHLLHISAPDPAIIFFPRDGVEI
jgi:hypothetical protein